MRRRPVQRPKRRLSKSRRYHLTDDQACEFDYELPDWLVGGD